MAIHIKPSRRNVLKGSGALVVSFSILPHGHDAFAQGAALAKPLAVTEVDTFHVIDAKGAVTLYSGKVDLGTGVKTALAQIVADELDVPFTRINVVQGDTASTPEQGSTWGSLSIQVGGIQIRQAAAAAKAALLDQAATRLGVNKEDLKVADGIVAGGSKRVTFGQLVGGKRFSITLDPKKPVPTKDPKDFKVVGTSVPRVDIPGKATGTFTYMHDFRVPGMLHARVVRPSAIGAKLDSVNEGSIKDIPTARVVRQGNFLAVVAENEWAAVKGARQLEATWSSWEGLPEQAKLYEHVRASKVAKDEVTGEVGNSAEVLAQGAKKLNATYDFAIHTHGSMGPSCAIAEFKDDKLTSWSASQATHNLRKQLAKMFSIPPEDVRCIYLEGSGCYGRNGHETGRRGVRMGAARRRHGRRRHHPALAADGGRARRRRRGRDRRRRLDRHRVDQARDLRPRRRGDRQGHRDRAAHRRHRLPRRLLRQGADRAPAGARPHRHPRRGGGRRRSEEHTSELQSL